MENYHHAPISRLAAQTDVDVEKISISFDGGIEAPASFHVALTLFWMSSPSLKVTIIFPLEPSHPLALVD